MNEIGRVRGLYIDFTHPERLPQRGDRLSSGKSLYYVLQACRVKRRDPEKPIRVRMKVIRKDDMPEGLSGRLIRSAIRTHEGSYLFEFQWNPRKRKVKTFEEYMRMKA